MNNILKSLINTDNVYQLIKDFEKLDKNNQKILVQKYENDIIQFSQVIKNIRIFDNYLNKKIKPTTPSEAIKWLFHLDIIKEYVGVDINKLDKKEIKELIKDTLYCIKILSYKYKK